jgi:2-dehydro-3-deoxyphosphogluconate aldolase / (4S)-4-hydroxy-2-oxoglutarate aldolase
MNNEFSWEAFNKVPVVGILRNIAREQVELLAKPYFEAGLTTLEITMNSEGAEETIAQLVRNYSGKLNIGAGTVCTMEELNAALSAGAGFIVTPILNEEVIHACVEKKIPVFPGAYTPTEIYKAWAMGASMVKVFPATQLGPGYIKDILAPLKQIKLIPTGGITLENFTGFLKAGAKGVGIGSHLFPPGLINEGRWDELHRFYSAFVQKFNNEGRW